MDRRLRRTFRAGVRARGFPATSLCRGLAINSSSSLHNNAGHCCILLSFGHPLWSRAASDVRHRVYPHLLWDVVNGRHNPSVDSPCLRDPLSMAFLQKYTPEQVTSNAAKAEVQALASMVHIDTTRVERRHATIRRRVLSHSLQGPRMSLNVVAAQVTVGALTNKSPTPGSRCSKGAEAEASAATSKNLRKRGGGGPWRMFVRERMSQQGNVSKDVPQPCLKAMRQNMAVLCQCFAHWR